jgi:hypothetical protein
VSLPYKVTSVDEPNGHLRTDAKWPPAARCNGGCSPATAFEAGRNRGHGLQRGITVAAEVDHTLRGPSTGSTVEVRRVRKPCLLTNEQAADRRSLLDRRPACLVGAPESTTTPRGSYWPADSDELCEPAELTLRQRLDGSAQLRVGPTSTTAEPGPQPLPQGTGADALRLPFNTRPT